MQKVKEPNCEGITIEVGVGSYVQIVLIDGKLNINEISDPYVTKDKIRTYTEKQLRIIQEAEHKLEKSERDLWWAKQFTEAKLAAIKLSHT